jgi:RND superfamily putative drug exporter
LSALTRITTSPVLQISIVAAWLFAALVAFPFASKVNQDLDTAASLKGSESAQVEADLKQRFKSPFTKIALLRIASAPDPRTAEGGILLSQTVDAVKTASGVEAVLSYADHDDELFLAQDASPIIVVGVSSASSGDGVMNGLRAVTGELRLKFLSQYPALEFRWTGEAAVSADIRRLSAASTRFAELCVLPVTSLLLIMAFRSVIAASLPILCGILTIWISLGVLALLNRIWPCSIIVVSIVSMVGLGLSIDYALLMVSRYHEALLKGQAKVAAASEAAREAGRTVAISGSAVAIGFAAMLIVPVSEVRSIGIGGLVVTAIAVLAANTLLPVILPRIDPHIGAGALTSAQSTASGRYWRRWAAWLSGRPIMVLIIAGVPLIVLAAQAANLRTDLPRGRWLPESADSVLALHEIDAVARGNFGQIINLVLELPPPATIQDESGWRAVSRLVRHYARDPRIAHVWSITNTTVLPMRGPETLTRIPEQVRDRLMSADGGAVLIQLLPKRAVAPTDAAAMVREIRAADLAAITGLASAKLKVGGVPAFNVDYENAIRRSLGLIAVVVVCVTLLTLSLAFRSLLIPLKAVVLNLLSVAAAFGTVAVVFQSGPGSRLLGLPRPLDGGFPIVPVLVFGIVFGLSMDYEVFLVARIADGRRRGLDDKTALIEGLAGVGRVITFAAAIMVIVFGGFVFGEFVLIKILGFALATAVLLDATLIRMAVGPALVQIAGRWNWWPGRK